MPGPPISQSVAACPGYLDPYQRVVDRAGACFEALLWRSPRTQTERFRVIAETADLTGRTLADLGCGRADFAAWLKEHGVEYGRYLGVDALAEMVEFSRRRTAGEKTADCEFLVSDFAADAGLFERLVREHRADCLVFSGSLNTMDQLLAEAVLERAWRALGRVRGGLLVFNFLSDRDGGPPASADDMGPARRFDTLRMAGWALERTPRVVLRHDYLDGEDATIGMSGAG